MIRERAAQGCAAFFVQRQNRCLLRNTQKAAKPLPTEKAVAVNLNGIYIRNVKDINK